MLWGEPEQVCAEYGAVTHTWLSSNVTEIGSTIP